jgi:hypothetical protein
MEVALGRGALTAPGGRDAGVAFRCRRHRPAHGLRILGGEIARNAEKSVLGRRVHDRQLPSEQMIAAIGINLVHHLDQRIVARDQDPLLTIAGKNHVGPVDRHRRGDRGRLFAGRLHVEARLALALCPEHAVVERAQQHHRAQHRAQPVGREVGVPRPLRGAIEVENPHEPVAKVTHRIGLGRFAGARCRFDRGDFDVAEIGRVAGAVARLGNVERQWRQIARWPAPLTPLGGRFGHIFVPSRRESPRRYISIFRHIIAFMPPMQWLHLRPPRAPEYEPAVHNARPRNLQNGNRKSSLHAGGSATSARRRERGRVALRRGQRD